MKVFDVHDRGFGCTIFAPNIDEALRLGIAHCEAGFGVRTYDDTAIERAMPLAGKQKHHLEQALALETAGVGHLHKNGCWNILPPGERDPEAVLPTRMTMYEYAGDHDEELVIFAADRERADLLHFALVEHEDVRPDWWTPNAWDEWQELGQVRHARQAEKRGIEGLGVYMVQGWRLLQLDYDALGVAPPS